VAVGLGRVSGGQRGGQELATTTIGIRVLSRLEWVHTQRNIPCSMTATTRASWVEEARPQKVLEFCRHY
jgi:hypothetical protein